MLKVGITGGIGSGKSIVCQVFHALGIPVFDADLAARELVNSDPALINAIKGLFGPGIYVDGKLNRQEVAAIVFREPSKLEQLNALIHPATIAYGKAWMEQQKAPYVIKEAAIFFESGSYKDMDVMIGVFAPKELRIQRAVQREGMSPEKVQERIASQMDEEEKMKRCDYVIINDGVYPVIPRVNELHQLLLAKAKQTV